MSQPYHIPNAITQRISAQQAFHYRVVPNEMVGETLHLLTDSEQDTELLTELEIVLGFPIALRKVQPLEFQNFLSANYRKANATTTTTLTYSHDFLDKILINAKEIGSSDIHFEPYEHGCRVRFRLDGKLVEQFVVATKDYPVISNKLKIKANLDIAEKRLPQDGRISIKTESGEFDIRVSTLPTLFGEKIVLRILKRDTESIRLEALGFNNTDLHRYKQGIQKPNGIVLISGPTGSGKTTTLYATLKLLNQSTVNILTIEDPIEYTLEGINQVQLKENIGLDFSTALRAFLRQDPNIIMVGEIRDVKTANMAIRAALTGHLVLSTIHTNSAWATVSRLIDMGIPPFLIASTLNLSVAQRLVRLLCNHCKKSAPVVEGSFPKTCYSKELPKEHFIPRGCPNCHHTGYAGRKAIYEILPINSALSKPIKNNALEINAYYKEHKISSLQENAMRMIKDGQTAIEEVYTLLST